MDASPIKTCWQWAATSVAFRTGLSWTVLLLFLVLCNVFLPPASRLAAAPGLSLGGVAACTTGTAPAGGGVAGLSGCPSTSTSSAPLPPVTIGWTEDCTVGVWQWREVQRVMTWVCDCLPESSRVNGVCTWDPCPAEQTRRNRVCTWDPCPAQQTRRGGICTWDPCPSQQTRRNGVCRWDPCPAQQTRRNGVCTWNPCPAEQTRINGTCRWDPCPADQTRRNGVCTWNPCPTGQARIGSRCVSTCDASSAPAATFSGVPHLVFNPRGVFATWTCPRDTGDFVSNNWQQIGGSISFSWTPAPKCRQYQCAAPYVLVPLSFSNGRSQDGHVRTCGCP